MPERRSEDRNRTCSVIFFLLLPFFLVLVTYYIIIPNVPADERHGNSVAGSVLLKVLTMLLLGIYVLGCTYAFQIDWKYGGTIFVGMCFSSAADGFSQYENKMSDALLYLLVLNSCSHLTYTIAFGFKPLKPVMGLLIALPFVGILMVLIPRVDTEMKYAVCALTVTDILMEWRLIVSISKHDGPLNIAVVATTIGAVSLVVSDALFSYNKFHTKIRFSDIIIPSVYYTGQLGIASSIFNLPHRLRPRNPDLHISGDECYEQLCSGCPFP